MLEKLKINRNCPYCGRNFGQTRKNQLFCCAKHGKNYHNAKYQERTRANNKQIYGKTVKPKQKTFKPMEEPITWSDNKIINLINDGIQSYKHDQELLQQPITSLGIAWRVLAKLKEHGFRSTMLNATS
jgi:protein-arginine kinase activator protein McsA